MKLCIIDNESLRQRNLRSVLSSLGYKSADVESFDDGQIAIANLKKRNYGLVFLYLTLPKMTGLEVLKEIKASSRLKSLPVIIYNSEVSKEIVVGAIQAGASGFVGYPFSVSDVESALKVAFTRAKK